MISSINNNSVNCKPLLNQNNNVRFKGSYDESLANVNEFKNHINNIKQTELGVLNTPLEILTIAATGVATFLGFKATFPIIREAVTKQAMKVIKPIAENPQVSKIGQAIPDQIGKLKNSAVQSFKSIETMVEKNPAKYSYLKPVVDTVKKANNFANEKIGAALNNKVIKELSGKKVDLVDYTASGAAATYIGIDMGEQIYNHFEERAQKDKN